MKENSLGLTIVIIACRAGTVKMILTFVNILIVLQGASASRITREASVFVKENFTVVPDYKIHNESDRNLVLELNHRLNSLKSIVDKVDVALVELQYAVDVLLSVVAVEAVVLVGLIALGILLNFKCFFYLVVLLSKIVLYIDNVFRSTTGVLPRKLVETILRAAGRIMPTGGGISISNVLRTVFNIQEFWARPFDFLPESEVTETDVKKAKTRLRKGFKEMGVPFGERTSEDSVSNLNVREAEGNNSGVNVFPMDVAGQETAAAKSTVASKFVATGAKRKYSKAEGQSSRHTSKVIS